MNDKRRNDTDSELSSLRAPAIPIVSKISYGPFFHGAEVAIIELKDEENKSKASKLASQLNREFPAFHALPGTNKGQKVLRLSLPQSDADNRPEKKLLELLQKGEQKGWWKQQGPKWEKLGQAGLERSNDTLSRLQRMAGPLAGAAWSLSSLTLLVGALAEGHPTQTGPKKDYSKAMLAASHLASNLVVILFTGQNKAPRDWQSVTKDMDAYLYAHGATPLNAPEREHLDSSFQKMHAMLKRYPWEFAGILNLAGFVALINSSKNAFVAAPTMRDRNSALIQGAGAVAATAGSLVQMLVPQKNDDRLFDTENFRERIKDNQLLCSLEDGCRNFPVTKALGGIATQCSDWLKPNRLQVAGNLYMLNQIGMFVSAATGEKPNHYQLASSGISGVGYGMLALAKDPERYSAEDAAFIAAEYIHQNLKIESVAGREQAAREYARVISDWMQMQPEITNSKHTGERIMQNWQELEGRRREREENNGGSLPSH